MPSVSSMTRAVSGPLKGFQNDGSDGLLIDTMELVEPKRSKTVPNHLLETKIYSKVAQNAMVIAKPAVVHFGGFEADKKHVQKLSIVNASTDVIRMHIIPPQTKYFYIKYKKSERLVPGLTIDCTIEFTPDEWRYYYDCIRINCPGEQNLVIPIHAYPVMSTKEFPTNFTFPNVPVGHRMTQIFPLRCDAPIDFEFQLAYLQPHPAFTVDPMNGIIPAQGEADVAVTFAPFEFQTALMKIQLTISQFNSKPIVCQFTGSSVPGLLRDLSLRDYDHEVSEQNILDPRCVTPLERSRSKKKIRESKDEESFKSQEIEYGGVRFPPNLETPYAVAQVLNQEPGKLRAKDLRETVLAKSKPDKTKKATRQMKEALFEHNVRQNVYEERQNQLRWQVKLGDDQITNDARASVLAARGEAWDEYVYKRRGDPVEEDEFIRTGTKCTLRRTFRDSSELAPEEALFDTYTNDLWAVRHRALSKFAQAARKVIIRSRADVKLKSLAMLVTEWKDKKFINSAVSNDQQDKMDEDAKKELIPTTLTMAYEKIHKFTFPTYVPPNVKDDMAPDALGKVPFKPTEVVVKTKVPYFGLKVPQTYRLMGYDIHESHTSASGYVAPKLARPLKTGAEDEVITLSAYQADTAAPRVVDVTEDGPVTLPEGTEDFTKPDVVIQSHPQPVALTPPKALFHPIEYPPLHIFNPAPGLQVFQAPAPYAEVDPDFHLCPLPRYIRKDYATNQHAATQRKYLDREDVVRGVMTWKKFPSQGLTSLSNTPTLTNVWVPRWDDQFDDDLLPRDVPDLLDSLPDEDKQNILDEEEEEGRTTSRLDVTLTPEMVTAQFSLIDTSTPTDEKTSQDVFPYGNKLPTTNIPVSAYGPVPREKREEEIEFFMMKKYNKLGGKIQTKTTQLDNLITDPKLVLK
ncbi:cilia- and flagella-associated protein 221-like isoform X2 [Mytilus edulis]|uniref:cilia- and flagella-associated protein 221-like isoform X2 n=1 Tax=Mytilus edulis TaxID=6550 RepID=UPI0039F0D72D